MTSDSETVRKISELCTNTLFNYIKRNSVVPYIQSHGPIAMLIAQIVANAQPDQTLEIAFWLYATVIESILPVGYFNLMVEPLVLSKIFNSLFKTIDSTMAS